MKKNLQYFKRFTFTLIVIAFSATILPAQVAINDDGTPPENSAMLDVKSDDKGLLIPRLTTTARNTLTSTAVEGLMVWDEDLNKFFFFNGITWDEGSVGGGLWTKNGAYTYLSNSGDYVGIGTSFPGNKLDVYNAVGPSFIGARSADAYAGFIIDKGDAADNGYIMYRTDAVGKWYVGMIGDDNFAISADFGSPDGKFFIDNSSGNVGIGTASPAVNLEVANATGEVELRITRPSSSFASLLTFNTLADEEWSFLMPSGSGDLLISRGSGNGTANLGLMHDGGKVGIGTNSPARTLEVVGSDWKTARISSTASGAFLEFKGSNTTNWAFGSYAGQARMLSTTDAFVNTTDEYWFSTTSFYPYSNNAKTLGASGNRWSNLYSYDADFSDDVVVGDLLTVTGTTSIGTATHLGKLHVHDGVNQNTIAYISSKATNDSATLFFSEGTGATLGMYWMYDGYGDEMELWGRSSSSDWGPHLLVKRNSGDVAIGSDFATGYKLSVDGKIICEELRVDLSTGWPDYVFGKDYKLLSLKELDSFIEINGHLPNIPAAEEIQESGLEVGEMQRLMMEKIEELSLYVIQQQKEIDELKKQINKNQK